MKFTFYIVCLEHIICLQSKRKMKRLIIPLFCLAILLVGTAILFISNYGGKEKIKDLD